MISLYNSITNWYKTWNFKYPQCAHQVGYFFDTEHRIHKNIFTINITIIRQSYQNQYMKDEKELKSLYTFDKDPYSIHQVMFLDNEENWYTLLKRHLPELDDMISKSSTRKSKLQVTDDNLIITHHHDITQGYLYLPIVTDLITSTFYLAINLINGNIMYLATESIFSKYIPINVYGLDPEKYPNCIKCGILIHETDDLNVTRFTV